MALLAGKQIGQMQIGNEKLSGAGTVNFLTGSQIIFNAGAIARVTSIPSNGLDIVNKNYVDAVAGGLFPLAAADVATTADLGGTFTLASPAGPGDFITVTGNSLTLDGVTVTNGMSVLVHHQTTGSENGIYVVSGIGGTNVILTRRSDLDGVQPSELTWGKYCLVLNGATHGKTGFVLIAGTSTNNPLLIDVDDITFTPVTAAGTMTASDGVTRTGNNLTWTPSDVTTGTSATGDYIFFGDITNSNLPAKETIANFISTHGLVSDAAITGTGYVIKTGTGYVSRSFAVSTADAFLGLKIENASGIAGATTLGFDIDSLANPTGSIAGGDLFVIHNVGASKNEKRTYDTIFANFVNSVTTGGVTINTSGHGLDFFEGDGINISNTVTAGQIKIEAKLTANGGIAVNAGGDIYVNLSATALSGTLPVTKGGTGKTSIAAGSIWYGGAANTLTELAIGTNGKVLGSDGNNPIWVDNGTVASVGAGLGLSNSGTSTDPILDVNLGNGLQIIADTINLKALATATATIANAINVGVNGIGVNIDGTTIGVNVSGELILKGGAIQTTNLLDGAAGTANAQLAAATADGWALVSSGNGFAWEDPTHFGYTNKSAFFLTALINAAADSVTNTYSPILTAAFGTDTVAVKGEIAVYVNGMKALLGEAGSETYADCWFADFGDATYAAINKTAITNTSVLVWYDTNAGYNITGATDKIEVKYAA